MPGSQRPRIEKRPDAVGTHGPKVVAFARACGVILDDWQAYLIDRLFDYTASGEWAATEAAWLLARQNGKGEVLLAYDLAHLFLFPRPDNRRKTILHSAHEFKTAVEGFDKLRGVVESTPQLMKRVAHIYEGAGQQQIILHKRKGQKSLGDRIKFVARSKSSGRGFSADILVCDEAQELSQKAYDALTYTQTTILNGQVVFCGTVPDETENNFEVFEGVRDRGRSGPGEHDRTYWAEWSPPGAEDPDLAPLIDANDRANWAWANAAYEIRVYPDKTQKEHDRDTSATKESFRRERLSIWPNARPDEEVVLNDLDLEVWHGQADPGLKHGTNRVLSVRVADSGGYASISCASRLEDGRIYVEHKHTDFQTLWVPKVLKRFRDELGAVAIVLDAKKCAGILSDLKREGIRWLEIRPGELAGAHALFVESVNAGQVAHRGQDELTTSLRFAQVRNIGAYGQTWEQSDESEPITQAQTVTEAHWGVKNYEANPPRSGVVRGYGG